VTDQSPPSNRWPLEGYFKCGDGFLVTPDCLGQTFQSRTASHALSITLPEINPDIEAGLLRRPPWRFVAEGEDRNIIPVEGHDWGSIVSGKKDAPRYAHILRCVVHSEISAGDEDQFKSAAQQFGNELAAWWTSACNWLDVLTLQDFVGLGRAQRSVLNDSLQVWSGDSDGIRKAGISYQVMTDGIHHVEVLDRQQLQAAMDLAASETPPQSEWLFVRDARSLLKAGEYRRAVIDACTAAELSVTALIDRKFDLAGTSQEDREQQFADHHGLSKLIELHNKFRTGKVPKRLYEDVGAPRNKSAHDGATSSESEARAAIVKAAEVVEMAYPLSSVAPGITTGVVRASPFLAILPQRQDLYLTTGSGMSLRFEL
jgi:hypothetical protein